MTCFYPTNQNTLYLQHLFYSDNEIITECGRPAICTLIYWFKSSRLFISLFGFCDNVSTWATCVRVSAQYILIKHQKIK